MVQSSGLFGGWGHAIQIVWCPHECWDLRACAYAFVPGFVTEEQDFDFFLWDELDKGEHSDFSSGYSSPVSSEL